jgi:hypothetical protein
MVDLPEELEQLARDLPPLLSVKRALEVRGCCRATLYKLLGKGRISALKDGRSTRVITRSLLADLASLPAAEFPRR